jgi:hypothetical protein
LKISEHWMTAWDGSDDSSTLSPGRTKRVNSVHPAPQDREDRLCADLCPSHSRLAKAPLDHHSLKY